MESQTSIGGGYKGKEDKNLKWCPSFTNQIMVREIKPLKFLVLISL